MKINLLNSIILCEIFSVICWDMIGISKNILFYFYVFFKRNQSMTRQETKAKETYKPNQKRDENAVCEMRKMFVQG